MQTVTGLHAVLGFGIQSGFDLVGDGAGGCAFLGIFVGGFLRAFDLGDVRQVDIDSRLQFRRIELWIGPENVGVEIGAAVGGGGNRGEGFALHHFVRVAFGGWRERGRARLHITVILKHRRPFGVTNGIDADRIRRGSGSLIATGLRDVGFRCVCAGVWIRCDADGYFGPEVIAPDGIHFIDVGRHEKLMLTRLAGGGTAGIGFAFPAFGVSECGIKRLVFAGGSCAGIARLAGRITRPTGLGDLATGVDSMIVVFAVGGNG